MRTQRRLNRLEGIYSNTATALSSQPGLAEEGIRARVEAGFDVANDNGLSLSLSGRYDGIGDEGFDPMAERLGSARSSDPAKRVRHMRVAGRVMAAG